MISTVRVIYIISSSSSLSISAVPAFSKYSMPVILVDAHLTVVDAAVKGYFLWDKRGDGANAQTIVSNPKILRYADKSLRVFRSVFGPSWKMSGKAGANQY